MRRTGRVCERPLERRRPRTDRQRRCRPCGGRRGGRAGRPPLDPLDQRRRAEPAAAAHRHEAELLVRALELVQQRRDQPRAGRAERMAERDRAAVHVDPLRIGAELLLPGADDRREGLVHLEEVDVVDAQLVALEDLARGGDRAGEHDHGVDADGRLVDDPRARASGRARRPSRAP